MTLMEAKTWLVWRDSRDVTRVTEAEGDFPPDLISNIIV